MGDKKELIDLLNRTWDLIPYEQKPTYGEFNMNIPLKDNVPKLRELEKEDESLGIARFNTDEEGISILSLIATITEKGFGDRLAIELEDDDKVNSPKEAMDKKIIGFSWYYEQQGS